MQNLCLVLLAVFGILNVTLGSRIPPNHPNAVQRTCYDAFNDRVNKLKSEVRGSSISCDKDADLWHQIDERAELVQDLTAKCVFEQSSEEYFTCMKSISADNKKFFSEIGNFENIDQVEGNKTSCVAEIVEKLKYKLSSALYDLNLCVKKTDSEIPQKPAEFSLAGNEKALKLATKLKGFYEEAKKCYLNGSDYTCQENYANGIKYLLKEVSLNHSEENITQIVFKHLSEFDKINDSCVKQLFVGLLTFKFTFDMPGCFRNGYASVIKPENEDADMELIKNITIIHKSFDSCSVITKDLDSKTCTTKQFQINSPTMKAVHCVLLLKSDEQFLKLNDIATDLYSEHFPCISHLLKFVQYTGENMSPMEKGQCMGCFIQGYLASSSISESMPETLSLEENILPDLRKFQDTLKNCTLHPDTPGLTKCFVNYAVINTSFFTYLENELPTKFPDYVKIFDESDKTHKTCSGILLKCFITDEEKSEECIEFEKCLLSGPELNAIKKEQTQ